MTKVLITCTILIMMGSILVIPTGVFADTQGPEITNVNHIPKWPVYGDDVNITATISDPDGISDADIIYCNESACFAPIGMTRIGTTDEYYGILPFIFGIDGWNNGTWIGYDIRAIDNNSNTTETEKFEYFYVSEIDMTASIDKNTIDMGESVTINGSAVYNQNLTALVEDTQVTVKITDSQLNIQMEYIQTDTNGNFTIELPFDIPGEYQINVTLTDRTMSAYYEASLMVGGIVYLSEKVQMTTCYPEQEIWVNGTAKFLSGNPVINSDIEIKINETLFWMGKTDASGNYAR